MDLRSRGGASAAGVLLGLPGAALCNVLPPGGDHAAAVCACDAAALPGSTGRHPYVPDSRTTFAVPLVSANSACHPGSVPRESEHASHHRIIKIVCCSCLRTIVPSVSLLDIQNHCKVLVRAIASSGSAHVMPLRTDRRCFPQVGSSGSMQPVSGDRIYSPGSSATPAAPAVFPEGSVCFNKATAGDVFPL